MKKTVIEDGGLANFVKFTHSENTALKLNAIWSLKNLLYSADSETKRTVMRQLSYDYLIDLLNDPSVEIQEQALDLVRNLVCGKQKEVSIGCLYGHLFPALLIPISLLGYRRRL